MNAEEVTQYKAALLVQLIEQTKTYIESGTDVEKVQTDLEDANASSLIFTYKAFGSGLDGLTQVIGGASEMIAGLVVRLAQAELELEKVKGEVASGERSFAQ